MEPTYDEPAVASLRLTSIPNPVTIEPLLRPANGGNGPVPVRPGPFPLPRPVPIPGPTPPPTPTPAAPAGPAIAPGTDPGSTAVFPDQAMPNYYWYVPQFQFVPPAPGSTAPESPFSYSFSVSGHDAQSNPVLDAAITARIQAVLADDVRAQIPAGDQFSQVSLGVVEPSLLIPFRDSDTGTLTTTAVPATSVTPDGDAYDLVFQIHGNLARAAYGSLSTPGYQSSPTQLVVQFSFAVSELIQVRGGGWWSEGPIVARLPPGQLAPSLTSLPGLIAQRPVLFNPVPLPVSRWVRVPIIRTNTLDVLVPCAQFGQLYVDATDAADPQPVGCQDAIALGQLPQRLYTPIDALSSDDYQVLGSVSRPAVYLLAPRRYRVGRAAPGQPGVQAWVPLIRWIQEFDATHDTTLPCRLLANLQPDISPAVLGSVLAAVAAQTPNPTLLLPTSFGSGISGFTVAGWTITNAIATVLDGDTIQLSADVAYTDAVILNGMLTTAGTEGVLVGNASFNLTDGTSLGPVELHVDVVRLTGPWPDGPIQVAQADAASVAVTNNAENAAVVTQIISILPSGQSQVLADGLTVALPAGTTVSVPINAVAPANGHLIAAFTLADSSGAIIDQERIYIEDLHTTISIVNNAHMNENGITSVDVTVWLDGDTQTFKLTMTPDLPLFQFDLVQPIVADRQAQSGLLHLTATIHKDGQPDTTSGDFVADLHKGVIVNLSDVLATAANVT